MSPYCCQMQTRGWIVLALILSAATGTVQALQVGPLDRERGVLMLRTIRKDLEQRYYDSTFHGVDLAAVFDSAEHDIRSAPSNGDIFGIIAATLLRLNDSHTFFRPPERVARVDYGWQMRMVGDTAFVVDVQPGSDAEVQGLKAGDAVLGVDRYRPTRRDFWSLGYLYNLLSPQAAVTLLVRSPDPGAVPRRLLVRAHVILGKPILEIGGRDGGDLWDLVREGENRRHAEADRFALAGQDVLVWQLKRFLDEDQMDRAMKRAGDYAGLVVDARNNGGGAERALLRLISYFLDHVDTIGTTHRRHETVPLVSHPARRLYGGTLVVLVDGGSASAAELFARTMQLTRRGLILGDTTAGAVMQSMQWTHTLGAEFLVDYGVSVTDADIVMSDGGRLEGGGVVPDVNILPSGADLASGRDPALALAITRAGHAIDAAAAGRLFPKDQQHR